MTRASNVFSLFVPYPYLYSSFFKTFALLLFMGEKGGKGNLLELLALNTMYL